MRGPVKAVVLCLVSLALTAAAGCNSVPRRTLSQSQARAMQLYRQNQALLAERNTHLQQTTAMAGENQNLKQQLADLETLRDTLQQRVDNLASESNQIRDRFTSNRTPLPAEVSDSLEELEKKYPGFEFNPQTGVASVNDDILFASGSSVVRNDAGPLLQEVASRLNSAEGRELNLLIVGHTDDRPVSRAATRALHPDNWYLSAHRAIAVREALGKAGIQSSRFGVAGYGPYQPKTAGTDEASRAKNRRVEIYIVVPNESTAKTDLDSIVK